MQTISTLFETELRKLIEAEKQRIAEVLGNGYGIQDFAHYRYYVGAFVALEKVLEYCGDAAQTVDKTL